MRIRVPAVVPRDSLGLGQTDIGADTTTSSYIPPEISSPITNVEDVLPPASTGVSLSLPTDLGTPVSSAPVTNSQTGQTLTYYQYASGEIVDSNGNIIQGPTSGGAGSGLNLAQLLGAALTAATTAVKLNLATQSPSLIPGTSLVYNPATGQIANAVGTTQALTSSLSSMLPLLLLAGGAFLLISMMGKRS